MARNRLPNNVASITGAALKNPGRYRNRYSPKGTKPIGKPFRGMPAAERRYWEEFSRELPWLHAGHRALLRLACQLSARMDSDDGIGISAAHALSSVLSKLGATPVDESRVARSGDDSDVEFGGLFE